MIRTKIAVFAIIACFLSQNLVVMATSMPESFVPFEESNAGALSRMQSIVTYFLEKGVKKNPTEALKGAGYSDNAEFSYGLSDEAGTEILPENVMAMAALVNDYEVTENAQSLNYGTADVWENVKEILYDVNLKTVYHSKNMKGDDLGNRRFATDQFMFLEFVGQTQLTVKDPTMATKLGDLYLKTFWFEANVTSKNLAPKGAYWTQMEGITIKVEDTTYRPFNRHPSDNTYPLTNSSLWAAIGYSTFAQTLLGTTEDQQYKTSDQAIQRAETAFAYCDLYAWDATDGLYYEVAMDKGRGAYANTQVVALLACARLYQVTGKDLYLIKADTILNSIMKNYFVAGFGGIRDGQQNQYFRGYDNALFAYALIALGKATGSGQMSLTEYFSFNRAHNKYISAALTVMNFMNNFMWVNTTGTLMAGYSEWVNITGDVVTPTQYTGNPNIRLITTNMLAYYCLADTIRHTKPWFEYYRMWVIYTAVVLGVIILVIVLVYRRSSEGTKLPKVVKGLLGGED